MDPVDNEQKRIDDAKKRISEGKGTQEDFRMVGQQAVKQAQAAIGNIVGNVQKAVSNPNAAPAAAPAQQNWTTPGAADKLPTQVVDDAQAMLANMKLLPAGQPLPSPLKEDLARMGEQAKLWHPPQDSTASGTGSGVMGGTLSKSHPAPVSSTVPAGSNGSNQPAATPGPQKQVSDIVENIKQLDPLTFWDILEAGLKGWSGNFDTTRSRKIAERREDVKALQDRQEAREKQAEERAFQQAQAEQAFGQEKTLTQMQMDQQWELARQAAADKLVQMGMDRQTALMLADKELTKAKMQTNTPAGIAAVALGGGQ
jgi:hypothetical protein